jgi:hypothetical protein
MWGPGPANNLCVAVACAVGVAADAALAAWAVRAVREVNRPADAAFVEGYSMGFDSGWVDGRRTGRPSVVQISDRERSRRRR